MAKAARAKKTRKSDERERTVFGRLLKTEAERRVLRQVDAWWEKWVDDYDESLRNEVWPELLSYEAQQRGLVRKDLKKARNRLRIILQKALTYSLDHRDCDPQDWKAFGLTLWKQAGSEETLRETYRDEDRLCTALEESLDWFVIARKHLLRAFPRSLDPPTNTTRVTSPKRQQCIGKLAMLIATRRYEAERPKRTRRGRPGRDEPKRLSWITESQRAAFVAEVDALIKK